MGATSTNRINGILKGFKQRCFILLSVLFLTACEESTTYAPVVDAGSIEPVPKSGRHKVSKGESLYEIAWRYGLDYRTLAARNNIGPPYGIQIGQTLYLNRWNKSSPAMVAPTPRLTPAPSSPVVAASREPNFSSAVWIWPTQGQINAGFSGSNKGINITGKVGQPILASGSGKVVYAGRGLRGYGNLIIIKHNALFLSAYAHNQRLFVQEGDWVKQGQKIASMGNSGTDRTMLHFEVRRAGKPIDPISILQSSTYSRYNSIW